MSKTYIHSADGGETQAQETKGNYVSHEQLYGRWREQKGTDCNSQYWPSLIEADERAGIGLL